MHRFEKLQKTIGITFGKKKLLEMAFVHKSYVNESSDPNLKHNERLEFLGDAVLELIVTEYLYAHYDEPEGELTNWRSALVNGERLAEIAKELDLGAYLYLSHGEKKSGGDKKNYILANTFEALLGAIYLDQGYECSRDFVKKYVIGYLEEIIEKGLHRDAKSYFQEMAQEKLGITPEYRVLSQSGPDHRKMFTMAAFLKEEHVGTGTGFSKQNAEQSAAEDALKKKKWKSVDNEEPSPL
ncbi:ribonuclease III [Candidatus Peregrinibacteria bacterium]|nr:ribonuclease III [Candidatus Peregrinibacteria bacterium]